MNFYQQLQSNTEHARQSFLQAPIIQRCFNGDFNLNDYIAFLQQAYHHVKFTVPLLMATGAKLNEDKEWLREAIGEYIEEEMGHQEWILNDLAACGVDKEQARKSQPAPATELMVAYAFDAIARKSPLYFFGMVFVFYAKGPRPERLFARTQQTPPDASVLRRLQKQAFCFSSTRTITENTRFEHSHIISEETRC